MLSLNLSEHFFSIQGEGATIGYPSYFLRFKGCNLSCGISPTQLKEVVRAGKGNTNFKEFKGDLEQQNTATWTCDSALVWLFGDQIPFKSIINKWIDYDLLGDIKSGVIHLIWTGGEPATNIHQDAIVSFLDFFHADDKDPHTFNEIETNGTIYLKDELFNWLQQINCSAKLANSGMSEKRRIVPEAINRIKEHPNYWFKFVVSTENDIREIYNTYIEPFKLDIKRVCIMPGLDDQVNFHERTRFCVEMGIKYKLRALTRLHVSAWNKVTGV